MTDEEQKWNLLPEPAIAQILSHLDIRDIQRAGSTCKAWNIGSKYPDVWRKFHCEFLEADDKDLLACAESYGEYMTDLTIQVDQHETINRQNACGLLNILAEKHSRCLQSLRITFVGENPLFYAGLDFVEALKNLFGGTGLSSQSRSSLTHVDLSGVYAAIDQTVVDTLSVHNPELESLNLLNQTHICKVHPDCITRLAERCKKLHDLRLFHCSLFDITLRTFAKKDRHPLQTLHILCRQEERISKGLSSEAWTELAESCPDLKVYLTFNHLCPQNKILPIMKPEIPVVELRLETHTDIYPEVHHAAAMYQVTLEKVVLQTGRSPELGQALIDLCTNCPKLSSLLVYCLLDEDLVKNLLTLRPDMRDRGTYILKWTLDPEPWLMKMEEEYNNL